MAAGGRGEPFGFWGGAAGMNHCGGDARAVPLRARGRTGPRRSVPVGSAGPAPAAPGCSVETGMAGVTGIPPRVSPSFVGGKRGGKAAVLRGAALVGCSVGRCLSGLEHPGAARSGPCGHGSALITSRRLPGFFPRPTTRGWARPKCSRGAG